LLGEFGPPLLLLCELFLPFPLFREALLFSAATRFCRARSASCRCRTSSFLCCLRVASRVRSCSTARIAVKNELPAVKSSTSTPEQ